MNTGWSGGSYGVGKRIKLANTRAIIDAIHSGALADAKVTRDPCSVSMSSANARAFLPRSSYPATSGKIKPPYEATANKLAGLFRENFKTLRSGMTAEIKAAGP